MAIYESRAVGFSIAMDGGRRIQFIPKKADANDPNSRKLWGELDSESERVQKESGMTAKQIEDEIESNPFYKERVVRPHKNCEGIWKKSERLSLEAGIADSNADELFLSSRTEEWIRSFLMSNGVEFPVSASKDDLVKLALPVLKNGAMKMPNAVAPVPSESPVQGEPTEEQPVTSKTKRQK